MPHHIVPSALAIATLMIVPTASAQTPASDTLRLSVAVATARALNPTVTAARLRADAALERIPQAGVWSDPQLTLGLMNRPLGGFGAGERMTMNQVQLSQAIPWPGKRGQARQQAEHLAQAEAEDAAEVELTLVGRVTARYVEVAAIDRTITIMARTRELLREFFEVTRSRYAVGESPQQDLLQAQVAVARMTEEITVMEQSRIAAAARLNALLGGDDPTSIGALELPAIGDAPLSLDSLMARAVANRPAFRSANERQLAAGAAVRAAKLEMRPDITVALGYGQRPQFDDMASLMVGFSLPLRAGSRQRPLRREMEAMEAAKTADLHELHTETLADLTAARAEVDRARRLSDLYASAILPQARASVEAALSAYRVGQVDYMTLVENEMTVNRYEIELVRITAQYHEAMARIVSLTGDTEVTP
jgi:cobalt-zinc-cadmium efflux system outer membrane protein